MAKVIFNTTKALFVAESPICRICNVKKQVCNVSALSAEWQSELALPLRSGRNGEVNWNYDKVNLNIDKVNWNRGKVNLQISAAYRF